MKTIDELIRAGKNEKEEKNNRIEQIVMTSQTNSEISQMKRSKAESMVLLEPLSERSAQTRRTKPILGRTIKIGARYTPEEYELLCYRIKSSGLPQGEYLRQMSLHGKVLCQQKSVLDNFVLKDISDLRADIGRLAGLLIQVRKAYESQHTSSIQVEDWMAETELTLQRLKEKVHKMEKDLYGDH